ncbi:Fic family protein [Candidatus Saccharibacteria bacterium]|nr:MAG: Fic family protein [Candidatus Saccharibacteria bacterium]
MKLQKRQSDLLNVLFMLPASTAKVLEMMTEIGFAVSDDTIQRDVKALTVAGLVASEGAGPSRQHSLTTLGRLHIERSADAIDAYLRDDARQSVRYLLDAPEMTARYIGEGVFGNAERMIVTKYQHFLESLDSTLLARWRQKWLIEFAWKSSSIEGNTYSELETETLLLDRVEAAGKTHQEAVMIVNHQKAYDFILGNRESFKTISRPLILRLHELLVQDLDVSYGLRTAAVRISGSKYIPLTHSAQIDENFDKVISAVNSMEQPLDKALAILLLISYLQPFADGNKRTARVLANAILESNEYPPITLGSIEPTRYRRACIAFYEMNDISLMKQIVKDSYGVLLDIE